MQMSPCMTGHDRPNIGLRYAKLACQRALRDAARRVARANRDHLIGGQSCAADFFTARLAGSALRHSVADVLQRCAEKQVRGVDAAGSVAGVANKQSGRDGAMKPLIDKAMGLDCFTVHLDLAVAVTLYRAGPQPTRGSLFDTIPEGEKIGVCPESRSTALRTTLSPPFSPNAGKDRKRSPAIGAVARNPDRLGGHSDAPSASFGVPRSGACPVPPGLLLSPIIPAMTPKVATGGA